MEAIVVRVMQLNCPTKTIPMSPGSTAGQVFEEAELEFVNGEVTRRHVKIDEETVVEDNDVLMISKMTKGNQEMFEVEILTIGGGGRVLSQTANPGYTIKQVLDQLPTEDRARFFRPDGTPAYDFRLGGTGAGSNDALPLTYALNAAPGGKVRLLCSQIVKGNE
jgi:hypothetical protein